MTINNRTALAALLTTALLGPSALAADGITVSGTGEATAKPTSVEMSATVSADAELTADAVVKFNDALKKSLAALDALKLPDLKVTPQGMTISTAVDDQAQMRMMQGIGNSNSGPPKTRVSEQIKIVIAGIDKAAPADLMPEIMKVIDAGRDAGLSIGPPQPKNYYQAQIMAQSGASNAMAQFKVDDPAAARDQAYSLAVKDAKSKAERLAGLTGVKLGAVLSVQDSGITTADPTSSMARMIAEANGVGGGSSSSTVSSGTMGDISVKVTVTVQYAIEK